MELRRRASRRPRGLTNESRTMLRRHGVPAGELGVALGRLSETIHGSLPG